MRDLRENRFVPDVSYRDTKIPSPCHWSWNHQYRSYVFVNAEVCLFVVIDAVAVEAVVAAVVARVAFGTVAVDCVDLVDFCVESSGEESRHCVPCL